MAELGIPAFRGKQLGNQYFGRLEADPGEMTDIPADLRERIGDELFPPLST